MTAEPVALKTADGQCDALFFCEGEQPKPGIILFMDGLGLRQSLIDMAARLSALGYAVLMPDMYYRHAPYKPFVPKETFDNPAEHQRLMGMVSSLNNASMTGDARAAIAWMTAEPRVAGPIGVIGYCMGGRAAMLAAPLDPRIRAVACIHGASIITDANDSPHFGLLAAQVPSYIATAGIDIYFTSEEAGRLATALRGGGLDYEIENYAGAEHGFAVDDSRNYDRRAAERHWRRIERFFGEAILQTG